MPDSRLEFENIINYEFKDKNLLKCALTHSSYAKEKNRGLMFNERLEFLGDAVLGMSIAERLYNKYVDLSEGELTKIRAAIVCEQSLAEKAIEVNLGKYLFIGKGEEISNGRFRTSILADAMEAVIAAVYLDGGYVEADKFIFSLFSDDIDKHKAGLVSFDNKTALQEKLQAKGDVNIEYRLIGQEGPDHRRFFTVAVYINGTEQGIGSGYTKKEAEQSAAGQALGKLHKS